MSITKLMCSAMSQHGCRLSMGVSAFSFITVLLLFINATNTSVQAETFGTAGEPYPNMPLIAPLGVRIGNHLAVPESARGPAVDPAKGYRIQLLGRGLYMVTDNKYQ